MRICCRAALRHAQCLFFLFGILLGISFGCTLTLMFTGWKTTYYYYNGNGVTVELDSTSSPKVMIFSIIAILQFYLTAHKVYFTQAKK